MLRNMANRRKRFVDYKLLSTINGDVAARPALTLCNMAERLEESRTDER